MTEATDFEKQIARIYNLLVDGTAEVTWNDKVPDPDNPKQLRQIDITIKKSNEITHVECRSHKDPQNTKWIEELFGRKISLKATAMIAVSDSGFTEGAILKSKKLGIFLRNLNELTRNEVSKWGESSAISIHYYLLSNISFRFIFKDIRKITTQKVAEDLQQNPDYLDALFNKLKYRFNSQRDINFPYCFRLNMHAQNMILSNEIVSEASVQGEVNEVVYKFNCPSVYEYRMVENNFNSPVVKIEKAKEIKLEILKAGNGLAAIHFDLSSSPQAPMNSILAGVFQFDRIPTKVECAPKFNLTGSHEQKVYLSDANFSITCEDNEN